MHVLCCDELFHKYRVIRYNLCFQVESTLVFYDVTLNLRLQLKRYDACCSLFKELCAHELKYEYGFEQQMYAFMIQVVLGLKVTTAVLQRLTPAQLTKIVLAPLQFGDPLESSLVGCVRTRSSI